MIAVIDYKAGNLTSVVKALTYLGAQTRVTQDADVVRAAAKIVLPGVGHFQATALLQKLGITEAVREAVARGAEFPFTFKTSTFPKENSSCQVRLFV